MILDPLSITSVSASSRLGDIATVVTVRFAYDWATGDSTGSVTYQAPEQIKLFGVIEKVIEATFCPTGRQACRLAEYWCKRLSAPQYMASIESDRCNASAQISDQISLVHPNLPGGSIVDVLITGREYNPETGDLTLTALVPPVSTPAVKLSGHSGRFTPKVLSGTKVVSSGSGTIDLVISDDSGTPLAGALATLDGGVSATADASGRVVFKRVATGKHVVEVRATGYEVFTMEVTA